MGFLIIDRDKCDRDGICVAECPERVIAMGDEGFPALTEFSDKLCIRCGHCVTVCPQAALALDFMEPAECPPIRAELTVSKEMMEHHIRSRRSIRTYKKKPVERETLKRLIETARYGPTAKNFQTVKWIIVENHEKVNRLGSMVIDWMRAMLEGEVTPIFTSFMMEQIVTDWDKGGDWICRGAPHMIVAYGSDDPNLPLVDTNCAIALTTLELAAPAFGLGACWGGYFNAASNLWPPLNEALDLPEGHHPHGAMMIGYPVYGYKRIPLRNEPDIQWR
jgi:nitroreductase/NAD-dependent dihydropyrimidine dehydrogenase PreA subunit